MKNYIQPGDTLPLIAPAAVSSGDLVAVGQIVGVACVDAAKDDEVEVNLVGVYSLPKAAEAISAGDPLYYDAANTCLTKTSAAGLTMVGVAAVAALLGDATVTARLDGVTRLAVAGA